jgi:uncharacterized protein YggE
VKTLKITVLISLVGILSLTFAAPANAQLLKKLLKKDVPPAVLFAFEKEYPNAKIKKSNKEERDGKIVYVIESTDSTTSREIVYTVEGTVVEMKESIPEEGLPEKISTATKNVYPKYHIKKSFRIARGDSVTYEVQLKRGLFKSMTLEFSSEGDLLKSKD